MKPGLRQIQIVPFRFRQKLTSFHIVKLYSKNLNRTAVIAGIWNIVLETGPSAYDYSKDPNHPLKASFLKKLHSDK
jgi:hypothetical protein